MSWKTMFVLWFGRSEEHTSELQSRENLVCRLLLEKKKVKACIRLNDSTVLSLQYFSVSFFLKPTPTTKSYTLSLPRRSSDLFGMRPYLVCLRFFLTAWGNKTLSTPPNQSTNTITPNVLENNVCTLVRQIGRAHV